GRHPRAGRAERGVIRPARVGGWSAARVAARRGESTMSGKLWLGWVIALPPAGFLPVRAEDAPRETVRYVRPAAQGFTTECRFLITRHEAGWTLTSWTDRGEVRMEVETRYDAEDRPTAARAALTTRGMT